MKEKFSFSSSDGWGIKSCPICKEEKEYIIDSIGIDLGNITTCIKMCDRCFLKLSNFIKENCNNRG